MATNVSNILTLPLFTGLTKRELEEIANDTAFSLRHFKKGATIATADNPCTELMFVCQGWIEVTTVSDDRSYTILEALQAIHTIEPDKLFGLQQRYHSSYVAASSCEVIAISKESLGMLISRYLIVRINYLNMICRKSQQMEHAHWRITNDELKQRIAHFIRQRCLYPAGKKVLHITMNHLAKELNDSRLNVSVALKELTNTERIIIKRGIIEVPALQLL